MINYLKRFLRVDISERCSQHHELDSKNLVNQNGFLKHQRKIESNRLPKEIALAEPAETAKEERVEEKHEKRHNKIVEIA